MTYIYDASFGHAQITPAALTRAGADGVILYAGCDRTDKNATPAEIHALLDAGFHVGLVIENYATDAIGGGAVGDRQGSAIVAAAKTVGYDWQNCVLFAGYDTDSHPGEWPTLLRFMEAFARHVPVPGFYGDSDAIDYLHQRHPGWVFWQSDSTSFSPRNPTPNAHLLQKYNDPRAHGLPVDVNDVERTPLRLMGENMPLTDADIAKIKQAVIEKDGDTLTQVLRDVDHGVQSLATQLTALAAAVAKIQTQPVDAGEVAKQIIAHLDIVAK